MTGFLQRLAQRANGTARTVHVASGARFAPEPRGQHTPLRGDALAPEPTTPSQPTDTTNRMPPGASTDDAPAPVPAPEAPDPPVLRAPRRRLSALTAFTDEVGAAPTPARKARADAPTSDPHTPDPAADALATRSVPPATDDPATPGPHATPATSSPGSSPEARPAWNQIEPLLSPVVRVRQAATAAASPLEPRRPGHGSRFEETTEVHVSIGRIEITAIHEPATTTQRPAAHRKAPLSLDEYLARRQGGRS